MASRYTVDFFIKKFRKTPESRWTTGILSDGPAHCALGHCGMRDERGTTPTAMSKALDNLFIKNLKVGVVDINDSTQHTELFINSDNPLVVEGLTPRKRVLNALKLIKKLQLKGAA